MSQYFSPCDLNPLNINPLKEVIERFVDFEAVCSATGVRRRRRCRSCSRPLRSTARRTGTAAYSADSKLSTDYDFFRMLHASSRHAARLFL
jgi:hypothetical protein